MDALTLERYPWLRQSPLPVVEPETIHARRRVLVGELDGEEQRRKWTVRLPSLKAVQR